MIYRGEWIPDFNITSETENMYIDAKFLLEELYCHLAEARRQKDKKLEMYLHDWREYFEHIASVTCPYYWASGVKSYEYAKN
jgi:hypothetical protein